MVVVVRNILLEQNVEAVVGRLLTLEGLVTAQTREPGTHGYAGGLGPPGWPSQSPAAQG